MFFFIKHIDIKNIDTTSYHSHNFVLRQSKFCWHDTIHFLPVACLGYLRQFDKKYVHQISLYTLVT